MNNDKSKLEKALELMNQRGLDGLIIYSNGTRNMLIPAYLQYFAEFRPIGANNAVIISKSGNVSLLVEPQWDSNRVSESTWIRDIRGSTNFLEDLIGVIRDSKLAGSVGIAGSGEMAENLYVSIEKEVKIELADDIIEEITKQKTKKEVDVARKAARIADIGYKALLKKTRVGIREYELAAEIDYAMRMAGSDDNFLLMSTEKHNLALHPPPR